MTALSSRPRPEPLVITAQQLTRLIDEYELQLSVADAQEAKTVYCMRLIADLYGKGIVTIRETMDMMVALDLSVTYPEPYGSMWRQFSAALMTDFMDVMLKADRVGTRRIFDEIDRSLRPSPIPPTKPGLLVRLFDGLFRGTSS